MVRALRDTEALWLDRCLTEEGTYELALFLGGTGLVMAREYKNIPAETAWPIIREVALTAVPDAQLSRSLSDRERDTLANEYADLDMEEAAKKLAAVLYECFLAAEGASVTEDSQEELVRHLSEDLVKLLKDSQILSSCSRFQRHLLDPEWLEHMKDGSASPALRACIGDTVTGDLKMTVPRKSYRAMTAGTEHKEQKKESSIGLVIVILIIILIVAVAMIR